MKSLGCFLFVLFLLSCSEENKIVKPEYSKIFSGNTKKTWKITGLKWTGENKEDVTFSIRCFSDDRYTFYANAERLFEVSTGTLKCSSKHPENDFVSDSWSFVNATSTLSFVMPIFSNSPIPFFVRKVASKEMTIELYLDQDNKYSYIITMQSVSEE